MKDFRGTEGWCSARGAFSANDTSDMDAFWTYKHMTYLALVPVREKIA